MAKEIKNLDEVPLMTFINGRNDEMKAMLASKSSIVGNNLPQQQLARNMRRRAASHKAKRLPIRLRSRFLSEQKKSGDLKVSKRPSRKFRRQHKNIFIEFARRKCNGYWLETHVWHAKRFHISNKWGWKLPMKRCDRGERAAYRDAKNQCLIQDMSYTACIEINGVEIDIISNLNQLVGQNTGPRFDASRFLEGLREGETFLYKRNSFPYSAIGLVSFLWKIRSDKDSCRKLWLFVHPSCQNEVLSELESFSWCKENSFKLITNELCQFRLIGQNSTKVLSNALNDYIVTPDITLDIANIHESTLNNLKCNISTNILNQKLAPNIVVGGLVSDPRIYLPQRKISTWDLVTPRFNNYEEWIEPSSELAHSLIWIDEVREKSRKLKATTDQFNQYKERYISTESLLSAYNPLIPILIIGKSYDGFLSRLSQEWHIITPSCWGMNFWISFIYRGGHSIGQNEYASISRERKQFSFPLEHPDTASGKQAQNETGFELFKKYNRRPSSKRCNYTQSGIVSMFYCPWKLLFNSRVQSLSKKDFFCLRDSKMLQELKNKLFCQANAQKPNIFIKRPSNIKQIKLDNSIPLISQLDSNYLVPIVIRSSGKGLPKQFAGIYLMLEDDISCSNIKQNKLNHKDQIMYSMNKKKTKKRNKNNKVNSEKNLASIDNILDNKNNIIEVESEIISTTNNQLNKSTVICKKKKNKINGSQEEQLMNNWELYKNETNINEIKYLCSRQLIGFVLSGGFSYIDGHGSGLGYVTIDGLNNLIEFKKQNLNNQANVLFRNTTSYIYHKAILMVAKK